MNISKNENNALNNLKLKINSWRMHKKSRGERMPKDLWREAIELACKHGPFVVAKGLRIDYSRLRREALPSNAAKKLSDNLRPIRMAEVKLGQGPVNCSAQKRMFEVETSDLKITFFH